MSDRPPLVLMVVHAHPDDEVIGTGGTFRRYAEEGVATILVCATRGEEGEIHDPDLDPIEARPRLGEIRTEELMRATALLKIGAVEFLGYRDSGMAGTPANDHPACFHQAPLEEATERLVRLIRRYRPHVLVSYNDFGGYGHPDHVKAYRVTHAAFERAADPSFAPTPHLTPWQPIKLYEIASVREMVALWRKGALAERQKRAAESGDGATSSPNDWANETFFAQMEEHSTPLEQVTSRIAIAPYREVMLAALRCHRTQIPPDSDWFERRADVPAELADFEHFNLVRSFVDSPFPESDLFAGLRSG